MGGLNYPVRYRLRLSRWVNMELWDGAEAAGGEVRGIQTHQDKLNGEREAVIGVHRYETKHCNAKTCEVIGSFFLRF